MDLSSLRRSDERYVSFALATKFAIVLESAEIADPPYLTASTAVWPVPPKGI